mmetsp:Transcript_12762/g.14929  ORF Transcript_12762/g.14929 Transcript_12762/m.14929 type:complete len:87 (+) Transcript_12762:254-514(+)
MIRDVRTPQGQIVTKLNSKNITFDAKTTILQLQCGHIYHVECIEGWAKNASKFSCPTCRCACLEQDDHHNPRDCCAPIDLPPVHAS